MPVSEQNRFEVINKRDGTPRSLEARLQRLQDKEAIHDLMMRYGHYCDAQDWARVCDLYTDNVERVLTGTLDERVKGKARLLNLYLNPVLPTKDGKKLGAAVPVGKSKTTVRHMFASPVIRIAADGKQAWLTSYFSLIRSNEKPAGFERHVHEGTYIFTFVKQGRQWKISKMVVNTEIGHDPGFQPPAKKGAGKKPAKSRR